MKRLLHYALVLFPILWWGAATPAAYAQDNNYNQPLDQWQTRDGYEYHVYSLLPLDWPEAYKTSGESCGLTAEQAAKYACKSMIYQGRPYYYYEDEHGQIYVRRPVVWQYDQANGSW